MDKNQHYFEQPLSSDELNFGWNSAEASIRNALKEGGAPFGIVSGYLVTPGAGLTVDITGTNSVAYDKQGRRIVPTVSTINQSIATATDTAGSTAVSGGGNERWVSVFARAGRKFSDAATDGNLLAVRKTVTEVLNNLGEGTHGAGAYDATSAKEAGLDKFYIVAGVENGIGLATRPALMEDAVLIVDIRLVQGQSTITLGDIARDRRQEFQTPTLARAASEDLYRGEWHGYRHGVLLDSVIETSLTALELKVLYGRGWVLSGSTGRQQYELNDFVHTLKVAAPGGSARQDLIIVDPERHIRLLLGTAGSPVAPTPPAGSVVLAEVRTVPGTTNTSTWPIARRGNRLLPYPFSTMSGILEGCKLKWERAPAQTDGFSFLTISSPRNKLVYDGEVVEFVGGKFLSAVSGTYQNFVASQVDTGASPFGSTASGSHRPYYIYACRKQFYAVGEVLPDTPKVSPVAIIESLVAPGENGRPVTSLTGPRGTIPVEDALLIGIGWTEVGTTNRLTALSSDDGWFYPQWNYQPVTVPIGPGNFTFPSVPDSDLVDKTQVMLQGTPTLSGQQILIGEYAQVIQNGREFLRIECNPAIPTMPISITGGKEKIGQFIVPGPRGRVAAYIIGAAGPNAEVVTTGVHVNLPRIHFGG